MVKMLGAALGAPLVLLSSLAWSSSEMPPQSGVELRFDDSRLRSLEAPPTQVADLSAAAAAGSQPAPAGASPGAALAGTLIGLGIVKYIEDARIRNRANAPFEQLRAAYGAHWRELHFEEALLREWAALASPDQQQCVEERTHRCARRVTLRPAILLLSGARILCVSIEAQVVDGKTTGTHYVRFLSPPLPATEIAEINDYWSAGNLSAIAQAWSDAIKTLVPFLREELEAQENRASSPSPSRAIRFVNAAGLFYDRGRILSTEGPRMAYRSLDGSIVSVYLDRLLTTEKEYYDWLAGKSASSAVQ